MTPSTHYTGAYTSLEQLIALRRESCPLNFARHKKTLAAMAGSHRSSFRGRGLDFDEVRLYQAGDEVRSIDWRVTARTGIPHTKLFREEREQWVYLLVDQKSTLFFGSQTTFKSVVAAQVAAWLAWASVANHDRVGGFIFSDSAHQEYRPKSGKQGVLHLLHGLEKFNRALSKESLLSQAAQSAEGDSALAQALARLQRVIRPGSLICIISDFYGLDNAAQQSLTDIIRYHNVMTFLISDPLEKQAPPPGHYTFGKGHLRMSLSTNSQAAREAYQSLYTQRMKILADILRPYPVPLLELGTESNYFALLSNALGNSARKARV
jgi:uncharacterized protein (DUF58 family)